MLAAWQSQFRSILCKGTRSGEPAFSIAFAHR